MSLATLPPLAKYIGEVFPELGGRALAVSESLMTKENVPTLPLVMVAMLQEAAKDTRHRGGPTEIVEDLVVEFWLKPERYATASGTESPFWSFYDYDSLRDRVLGHLSRWETPRGRRLEYVGLDVTSTDFAVVLCFKLRHSFLWCPPDLPEDSEDGKPIGKDSLSSCLAPYRHTVCDDLVAEPQGDDCSTAAINKRLGVP